MLIFWTSIDFRGLTFDGIVKLTLGADGKVFCMVTLVFCGAEAVSEFLLPHAVSVAVRHTAAKKQVIILFFIIFTPFKKVRNIP